MIPDPGTDPVHEDGPERPYGFWARLVGLPVLEQRLLRRIEELVSTPADVAALQEALAEARSADTSVDNIGPETRPRNHTGHRDGNPGASNKKGPKP